MSDPLPKRNHLDPRSAHQAQQQPIEDSVNIPIEDLPSRAAELPPKDEMISVAGPEPVATQTIARLQASGRKAEAAHDWHYGEDRGAGRLWEPNTWLTECLPKLEPGSALDLGCGSGRDAVFLAAHGWQVQAVDILPDAIQLGKGLVARYLNPESRERIDWQAADLLSSQFKASAPVDLVFGAFFFDRILISESKAWLNPGGSVILEAFTTVHQERHGKPTSPHRVVEPGEMAGLLEGLEIVELKEGEHNGRHTARVWARRKLA